MEHLDKSAVNSNSESAANLRSEPPAELLNESAASADEKTARNSSGNNSGEPPANKKGNGALTFVKEIVELVVVTLLLLIAIRWAFAEARYIPSSSMEPTLQINDRILVEKVSGHLRKPFERGDILVFYPPPSEMPDKNDLSNNPLNILGRLTGLPFLPYEPAFIKRVVGLPGDVIRVEQGKGVYINGQLLEEPYIKEAPRYNLSRLGDIGTTGRIAYEGRPQVSAGEANQPIRVPEGHLFMMGDNRNNSQDSHVWGFLEQNRVIGRACLVFWRRLEPPRYPPGIQASDMDSQ